MLDSNTILGIRRALECEEYEHGVITQSDNGLPCGVPVVFPKGCLDMGLGTIRVLTLMTPSTQFGGIDTINVRVCNIAPINVRPLCGNHKVLEVSEFDLGKFDRLIQFVRDVGGISLVIESSRGRESLTKSVFKISDMWKYTSLFYYNGWGTQGLCGEDDNYVCVLTFLDLPYCVPLFNMRKVDGLGLSFTGATRIISEENGQLNRIFRTDIIYSNYEDNIFVIDGVEVNRKMLPTRDHYKELNQMASQTLPVISGLKKGKKGKEGSYKGYGYTANPGAKVELHTIAVGETTEGGPTFINPSGEIDPESTISLNDNTASFNIDGISWDDSTIDVSDEEEPITEEPFPFTNEEGN